MPIGRIHSIETFSTLDGPGIRYVLFMQGCPLRCIYCHNPDTWIFGDGNEVELDDIVAQVGTQVSFLQNNNGGITTSGGEPLAQANFIAPLFRSVKEKYNITTAVDTSGCVVLTKEVCEVLDYCDYVLVDVKHVDPMKHVVITGRSLGLIHKFLRYVQSKSHIKIWIRHVMIPGYTTDEHDVKQIAEFIASIDNVERVDLLPYHDIGKYKWELLQRDYKLKDIAPPSRELVDTVISQMKEYGVDAAFLDEE